MARHLLNARQVELQLKAAQKKAASKDTRVRIPDGDGLRLEVRPSGSASWQLVFTLNGKKKPFTIGNYPGVSLAAARVAADKARDLVAQQVDPTEAKQPEKAAKAEVRAKGKTVYDIGQEYLADQKRLGRAAVYLRDIERAFMADLYPIKPAGSNEPLERWDARDVTNAHAEDVLRRIEARGAHVHLRRFLGWARRCFELAARHGVENPWPSGRLVGYLAPKRAKNRPAVRDVEGFAQLLRAIDGWKGSPISRAGLLLHAHTFVRPTELQYADWPSVDMKARTWTANVVLEFGEFDHLVPITPQTEELFKTLRPIHKQFILPGMRYGKRISEATLNAGLHALGYKDKHCTHGFRSTASTLLREMGWSGDWIEVQLSHGIKNAVEAAYNKAQYWPQRMRMMQCWSDYLSALIDPANEASKMLPLEWVDLWHIANQASRAANRSSSQ
jgi:integrase